MTVKELIELLKKEDQSALVYREYHDGIYFLVDEIKRNILEGKEKTIALS